MKTASPKALYPLVLLLFIDAFSYGLVIPIFLRVLVQHGDLGLGHGLSLAERNIMLSVLVAIEPSVCFIMHPLLGRASDRYGRKRLLSFALLLAVLGFSLSFLGINYQNLVLLCCARAISGIASSSQAIAQAAVSDLASGRSRLFNFSYSTVALVAGMISAPLLGAYFDKWGFVFAASLSFVNWLLVLMLLPETHPKESITGSHAITQKFFPVFRCTTYGLRQLCTKSKVISLLMLFLLVEFAWALYYQALPLLLTEKLHWSTQHYAIYLACMGVSIACGLLILIRVMVNYLSELSSLKISLIIVGLSYLATGFVKTKLTLWLLLIPLGLFTALVYPLFIYFITQLGDDNQQGWLLGLASSLLSLAWAISGYLNGISFNYYSALPFVISTILVLGSALWVNVND